MPKRTRGTSRPGQRRPIERSASRPSAARPAPGPAAAGRPAEWTDRLRGTDALTPDQEARAAELEERIMAEERSAQQAERQARERARAGELGVRREAVPLAVKAADEYAYVRRDIFRISRVAAVLFAVLAILHVLINVTRTISV